MQSIEQVSRGWRITGGGLALDLDVLTGSLSRLLVHGIKEFTWTHHPGDVTVRDDRIGKTFDRRDLENVTFAQEGDSLTVRKAFRNAPWVLEETYRVEDDALGWDATVSLDSGEFRSCAVGYHIPWPQPTYPISFWAAREKMPSAPHRFAEIALEYGEITSGILMPAMCAYLEQEDVGVLLTMPFDFRTPRFRFLSGHRDPDLQATFDWLALAPGRPARTSLLLHGTGGNWRPALGWLYERFKEYFEPRSSLIHQLWGGHISGGYDVSPEDAQAMASLAMKWHEIHAHFPLYGNYHPEGVSEWRSGHDRKNETVISVDRVRETLRNLHAAGIAGMPYIQVSGDGDLKLPAEFVGDRIRDGYGDYVSAWPETYLMNSDLSLPFGKDITRQINGMVERYPEMDGVFLDQACYNFLDTAHDDGITAVNNRPCYMTGFNYFPHVEHLSALLHPHKAIIANGPFGIGIMKYIDGFMAEGSGWLCDHLQYYGLAKPLFFLMYNTADRDIELMFQRCLVYGAGFSSYTAALASKDLYDRYLPLVERLFRRRWIFEADPLKLPTGYEGGLFRSPTGTLLASIVSTEPRLTGRKLRDESVSIRTVDTRGVKRVTLQCVGGEVAQVPFHVGEDGVQFDVPGEALAAVAELEF